MKPVTLSRLDSLFEHKPVLLLDIARLSINLINSSVNRSPGSISSKPGNKQLPLEIWLMILAFAAEKPKLVRFNLVQPQSLEHSNGASTLVCARIPGWDACGMLEGLESVWNYEYYLQRPNGSHNFDFEKNKGTRPFDLPTANNGDVATIFRIPTAVLERDSQMLFVRITVPDIIAWVERGECDLCGGSRRFCAGCRDGSKIAEEWTSWTNAGDCGVRILCPLCIGVEFANESIGRQRELDWSDAADAAEEDEYIEWKNTRLRELGRSSSTGCSAGGIGSSMAASLAKRNHHIFATARDPSKIPEDLSGISNVTVLKLDVTSTSSIADAVKAVAESGHGLDVLVNNAGIGYTMPILDIDIDKAQRLYDTNVWGAIRMIQGFADQLIASRGRIVNISTCAVPANTPWISTYVSSKAALTTYSETLRLELSPFGVDVSTIMIGRIDSHFDDNAPFTLPAGSKYAPIEEIITGWSTGALKPKGIPSDQFAESIVDKVVRDGESGVIWKGPYAGTFDLMWRYGSQSLCDAGMRHKQGLDELATHVKDQTRGE
ncbi:hypothetical protein ACJZ2D_004896 [Fusarium nematophilum]